VVPGVEIHAHRVLEPAWAVFDEKGATIAYTREIHAAGEPLDQSRLNRRAGLRRRR
jgi:hypothetical protein